ncbi:MAG: hypothetical protein Q4E24_01660 [bacterium]|nr:hypothetical protein [bacterium]
MNDNTIQFMSELLETWTKRLDNQFVNHNTGNMPHYPLLLLFHGENALEAQQEVSLALHRGWSGRANAVGQIYQKEGTSWRIDAAEGTREEMDEYGFQDMIDEVQADDENFQSMRYLILCNIYSSRDYESCEAFQREFERTVAFVRQELGLTNCMVLHIVLLDEASRGRNISREILKYLQEYLPEKRQEESIVVLSNRLKNGVLLNGEKLRENYTLIGSLLVLLNSSDSRHQMVMEEFFPRSSNFVLTVSYVLLERPNKKICMAVMQSALNWMDENQILDMKLDFNTVCQRLQISGGSMKWLEEFYNLQVKPQIPPVEVLEYLPRQDASLKSISSMSVSVFEQETMGTFAAFSERLDVFDEMVFITFTNEFCKFLRKTISSGEAAVSLSNETAERLLSQIHRKESSSEISAGEYMMDSFKKRFLTRALEICKDEMKKYHEESLKRTKQLKTLRKEFQQTYHMAAADRGLKEFYTDLTDSFLKNGYGNELLQRYSEGGEKQIYNVLNRFFDIFTSTEDIFSKPLDQEMAIRMGEDRARVQQVIREEIMSGVSDRARIQTPFSLSTISKTIMTNQQDERAHDTTLFQYLKSLFSSDANIRFYDTGDRNRIEVIFLHQVGDLDM